jgi:hypothetical protein
MQLPKSGMKYLHYVPDAVPEGVVLVHNVKWTGQTFAGPQGFRFWFAAPDPEHQAPCNCAFTTLPHFRTKLRRLVAIERLSRLDHLPPDLEFALRNWLLPPGSSEVWFEVGGPAQIIRVSPDRKTALTAIMTYEMVGLRIEPNPHGK